jgi:23S rRNA (guanosine2251-2'-O)-methyltransferase
VGKDRLKKEHVSLEGRNVVLEALRAGREISVIYVDEGVGPEGKIEEIAQRARAAHVPVRAVNRSELGRMSVTGSHQGVVALAAPKGEPTLKGLLASLSNKEAPTLVVLGEVMYEQNLGAILRTAEGAGTDGVIVPTRRGAPLSATVSRVSMGASEYVPVIRESPTSALAAIRRAGITIFGVEAEGDKSYFEADLVGPAAFVFGGEDKGLSTTIRDRCDAVLTIPLAGHITSLNVSVSVAIVLYERVRQEALGRPPGM